jgi:hypothetical protein
VPNGVGALSRELYSGMNVGVREGAAFHRPEMRLVRILASVAGAMGFLFAAEVANGAESASRIIDRTFRCTPVALYGGVRELDIVAKPRGSPGGRGGLLSDLSGGYISAISGPQTRPGSELIQVSARPEPRWQNTTLPPGVYANLRRCRPARMRVPLSTKGLPGPPVEFAQDADCDVRGRVLVRVRAVLEAPTAWSRKEQPYFGARRNVVEARIAVRTERTRRPIGLVEVNAAGDTRLWASSGCSSS